MSGHNPLLVVCVLKLQQYLAQLFDGVEMPHPKQVFLENANKAFGDAIALGFAHIGRGAVIPRYFNSF